MNGKVAGPEEGEGGGGYVDRKEQDVAGGRIELVESHTRTHARSFV